MEASGVAGKVNISGATCEQVKDYFICTHRGKIKAKNKGEVDLYLVEGYLPQHEKQQKAEQIGSEA
jgi:adenylate cyclase